MGLECVRESVNHEKRRAVCSSESRCAIVLIAWRWYCLGFGTWKMEQCTESCWHFDGAYTTCRMRVKSCWDWSSAHRLAPRSAREPGVMRLCRLSTTVRIVALQGYREQHTSHDSCTCSVYSCRCSLVQLYYVRTVVSYVVQESFGTIEFRKAAPRATAGPCLLGSWIGSCQLPPAALGACGTAVRSSTGINKRC